MDIYGPCPSSPAVYYRLLIVVLCGTHLGICYTISDNCLDSPWGDLEMLTQKALSPSIGLTSETQLLIKNYQHLIS